MAATELSPLKEINLLGITVTSPNGIFSGVFEQKFNPTEPIYRLGQRASQFYIIQKGLACTYFNTPAGQKVALDVLHGPSILGDDSLLGGDGSYTESAEAFASCSVTRINHRLMGWLYTKPGVAERIIQEQVRRKAIRAQLAEDHKLFSPARLARALFMLADEQNEDGRPFSVPLTHYQIAAVADMCRETASAALETFAARGYVRQFLREVKVLKPDELRRIAVV